MPYPDRFYPVVDSVAWVARLALLGAGTIQLRAKNLSETDSLQTVKDALEVIKGTVTKLVVNDYWRAAIATRAEHLHLGQEDLAEADVLLIRAGGLDGFRRPDPRRCRTRDRACRPTHYVAPASDLPRRPRWQPTKLRAAGHCTTITSRMKHVGADSSGRDWRRTSLNGKRPRFLQPVSLTHGRFRRRPERRPRRW